MMGMMAVHGRLWQLWLPALSLLVGMAFQMAVVCVVCSTCCRLQEPGHPGSTHCQLGCLEGIQQGVAAHRAAPVVQQGHLRPACEWPSLPAAALRGAAAAPATALAGPPCDAHCCCCAASRYSADQIRPRHTCWACPAAVTMLFIPSHFHALKAAVLAYNQAWNLFDPVLNADPLHGVTGECWRQMAGCMVPLVLCYCRQDFDGTVFTDWPVNGQPPACQAALAKEAVTHCVVISACMPH